jgi:predicted MFS family arabinose efflux permease
MLTVPDAWLTVFYVMLAQALSGIAKDLNKMSAKASVKTLLTDQSNSRLFKWVAILTGSKNTLKGAGFFIGAILLEFLGFRGALAVLAGLLFIVLLVTIFLLPKGLGKLKSKAKFTQVFSNKPAINWLSAARFFLFGSRDIWFVVALPVFLYEMPGWSFSQVGAFMALWIIGYGIVQASAPKLLARSHQGNGPQGSTARMTAFALALFPAGIALGMQQGWPADTVLIIGLILFGVVFALNSAVHSYLILAYSEHDKVAMNVGFYYMANAGGRLTGTILSGLVYQTQGLEGCLWLSSLFVILAALISIKLPEINVKRPVNN